MKQIIISYALSKDPDTRIIPLKDTDKVSMLIYERGTHVDVEVNGQIKFAIFSVDLRRIVIE